jgi:hypothetical protein
VTYGEAQKAFAQLGDFDPAAGETILAPAAPGPGNWVGCPSVLHDPARGTVLLTYRRRRPRGGPSPDRGYECGIAESADGVHFEEISTLTKDAFAATSMERFCLHRDPSGRYLLYVSYEHPDDGRWRIDVIEADAPDAFDPSAARTVLTPAATGTDAVKDPYVVRVGPAYYMYVSTFLAAAGPAPTSLAVSLDGVEFRWLGEALGVGEGWDRHQARLSCVIRRGALFLGLYDGAGGPEEDTEERLGVAVSSDLVRWQRLSVDAPWRVSPHATGSLRYPDALELDGVLHLYYECARDDGSHELRLNRLPLGPAAPAPGPLGP